MTRALNMKKHRYRWLITALLCLFCNPLFADYAIIVDAGSTGSRLHLFQYDKTTTLPRISDIFSVNSKPGLSSFANTPEEAGPALKKLFDDALLELQKAGVDPRLVSVNILGTAGMRLLPQVKQAAIYTAINNYLKQHYSFRLDKMETIPGTMEGLYGWLDVNYLQQTFQAHVPTVGSIDVGGVSTQLTFATDDKNQGTDTTTLTIANQRYTVFHKSFLGLGQDLIREAILNERTAYTCYPKKYPLHANTEGNFNFESCRALYAKQIKQHEVDTQLIPLPQTMHFIAYSGVYYTYDFFGVIKQPDAFLLKLKMGLTCYLPWQQLQKKYATMPAVYLATYCANGSYFSELLYRTYHLTGAQLTVTTNIANHGIDWTLGALLYSLIRQPV